MYWTQWCNGTDRWVRDRTGTWHRVDNIEMKYAENEFDPVETNVSEDKFDEMLENSDPVEVTDDSPGRSDS